MIIGLYILYHIIGIYIYTFDDNYLCMTCKEHLHVVGGEGVNSKGFTYIWVVYYYFFYNA